MEAPAPQPGEALVRIRACGICPSDVRRYTTTGPGGRPRTMGHEWVGEIARIEGEPGGFSPGDRVAVDWRVICGECVYCQRGMFNYCEAAEPPRVRGGFGEYGCAPLTNLRQLPDHVSYAEATFCEPLACCLNGIRQSRIGMGDLLVIIGCGPIGLLHLQLAQRQGARVVACDRLEARLAVAERLGAWATLQPDREDPVARIQELSEGYGADGAIVAVGGAAAAELALKLVGRNGTVNLFAGTYPHATFPLDPNRIHYEQIHLTGSHDFTPHDFTTALRLIATGLVDVKSLISHRLPLAELERGFELVARREGLKVVIEIGAGEEEKMRG